MTATKLVGALLAGGVSRRLGLAKCTLPFSGRPLGLHLLERLREFCDEAVILANDPVGVGDWGYRVLPDAFPGLGPLTGLHAALGYALAEHGPDAWVFLLACDLPFFDSRLGNLVRSLLPGYDAVLPRRGAYVEPLCAAYSGRLLPAIEAQLSEATDLRVISVLPGFHVRYLEQHERMAGGVADDDRVFLNINTPEDLARAREMWAERQRG